MTQSLAELCTGQAICRQLRCLCNGFVGLDRNMRAYGLRCLGAAVWRSGVMEASWWF
jgi:hypothetical protein